MNGQPSTIWRILNGTFIIEIEHNNCYASSSFARRLTVVEQTLDNVADKLNEFLVVYRERYYRQHKEDESPS